MYAYDFEIGQYLKTLSVKGQFLLVSLGSRSAKTKQEASKREPGKFCRTPSFLVYQAAETDTSLKILAIFIGLKGQNKSRKQIHMSFLWPLKNLCFLPM